MSGPREVARRWLLCEFSSSNTGPKLGTTTAPLPLAGNENATRKVVRSEKPDIPGASLQRRCDNSVWFRCPWAGCFLPSLAIGIYHNQELSLVGTYHGPLVSRHTTDHGGQTVRNICYTAGMKRLDLIEQPTQGV